MMYLKVLGVYRACPLESMKIDFICRVTNSNKETIQPILDLLVKEGHLRGKRTYRLTGKHLKTFHKNNKLP